MFNKAAVTCTSMQVIILPFCRLILHWHSNDLYRAPVYPRQRCPARTV